MLDLQQENFIQQGFQFIIQITKLFSMEYTFLDEKLFGSIDLSSFRLFLKAIAIAAIFVISAYTYSKFGILGGLTAFGLGVAQFARDTL